MATRVTKKDPDFASGCDLIDQAAERLYSVQSTEMGEAADVMVRAVNAWKKTPAGRKAIAKLGRDFGE